MHYQYITKPLYKRTSTNGAALQPTNVAHLARKPLQSMLMGEEEGRGGGPPLSRKFGDKAGNEERMSYKGSK